MFLHGLRFFNRIPFGLRLMTSGKRCLATLVFSNVGNIEKFFGYRFEKIDDGICKTSNLTLTHIESYAPCRHLTNLSAVASVQGNKLVLCCSFDRNYLSEEDVDALVRDYEKLLTDLPVYSEDMIFEQKSLNAKRSAGFCDGKRTFPTIFSVLLHVPMFRRKRLSGVSCFVRRFFNRPNLSALLESNLHNTCSLVLKKCLHTFLLMLPSGTISHPGLIPLFVSITNTAISEWVIETPQSTALSLTDKKGRMPCPDEFRLITLTDGNEMGWACCEEKRCLMQYLPA